jgi:hypothetical protein
MRFNTFLTLLFSVGLTACGGISTKPALYDATAIKSVQIWKIGFLYEAGFIEEGVSKEKGESARVVKEGQSTIANKLRDDIVFELKNQKFDVDRTWRDNSGEIRLFPIQSGYGGFRSVDVEFVLPNGKVAGRIQIKNEESKPTSDDIDDFTESVVKVIADTLNKEEK